MKNKVRCKMSDLDLSKVDHSMTKVLEEHLAEINQSGASGSVRAIYDVVAKLFRESNIDTPASNRLLQHILKNKTATSALITVYNSILSGSGNSVAAGTKEDWRNR